MNVADLEKEIRFFLKKYNPDYKVETIHINISSTFIARARCKECGEGPYYYYYAAKRPAFYNVRDRLAKSKVYRRFIKRLSSNWYLDMQPRQFQTLEDFKFGLQDKGYNPILHRTRGTSTDRRENIIELLGCHCGTTAWAFNNKSTKNRPEITNRKGRYSYPKKFEY